MTQKVLISILGKGQYNANEKKYDYTLTKYRLPNGTSVESKLVSDILAKKLTPEKIYIVGTTESLWNVANSYLSDYEKIIIPYGTNENEFWQIFDILTELDVTDKEIYFDITHGFRSIPLFVSTILNFFKNVKNSNIRGIYYGIFEAKDKNGITPVINMLPFLEMNDWIDAFTIFRKYSDGRDIALLMQEKFNLITNEEKKNYGKIQNTAKELDFYSKSIGFSAVEFYIDSLDKIDEYITEIDAIPAQLHAINYLLDAMRKEASEFNDLNTIWQRHLKAARLLFDKNRYAQSLTVLREVIYTYILEKLSLDLKDESLRENGIGRIIREEEQRYQRKKQTRYLSAEFLDLIGKIRELRNKSNHAFIKKSTGPKEIKNSVKNLKIYLQKTENFFSRNNTIKDKEALRRELQPNNIQGRKMLLLFSHKLTPEQKKDAIKTFNIKTFIPLPSDLQKTFSNIPANIETIKPLLNDFEEFIREQSSPGDFILIQGDFGIVCALVQYTKRIGRIPIYATTKRVAVERETPQGIEKISTFQHVRFRKYEI
jgi:CRISPR-associated DxTHG motif protein